MANINYNDLGLKKSNEIIIFKYNGKDIEIPKYLSIEDKYDIVMITLQKSMENGYYNPMKLDVYFHLNLVYAYTNIVFNDKQRQDETKLYDELQSSGFMDVFLSKISEEDYKEMQKYIEEIAELSQKYQNSLIYLLNRFIEDLPSNAEAAQKIVDNFDPDKYQAVVDFAKAANGGRQIT